ncbi:hypothetical protein R3W88_017075 [Solanum pinnatisectum]|uniref:AT-hook motif nuclear-localized protein n=1 Tax=Solanum pinnatisectum TaxID=50273 RepID=A0AAV9L3C3_9SOLN|nr:hypothetical protein R3W88_017075 [Solanum pinnatisectum]
MAASDASSDYRMTGSAQPAVATQSGAAPAVTTLKKKRGRLRNNGPNGSSCRLGSAITVYHPKVDVENLGQRVSSIVRGNLMTHIITVNTGEDVSMKVLSFFQQGSWSICILSATGVISSVILHQTDTSGGKVTFKGWYDLLTFAGLFVHSETGGMKNLSGGMSVSLISPRDVPLVVGLTVNW